MSRSMGRNIHFYDASNPDNPLGGLVQNGSVTEKDILGILEILLVTEADYYVQRRQDHHVVTSSDQPLQLGGYDIYCDGNINVNDEPWVHRIITVSNSARDAGFQEAIRNRDGGRCVFSGLINGGKQYGQWYGFEAAHILPLSAENVWEKNHFGRCVTHIVPEQSRINSVQNGFLMRGDLRQVWDSYMMSVNPDDNYKIVVFQHDTWKLDGRTLDPVCRDPQDSRHVSDELLRWHYRQCVFANMRGAGEPIFEHDYPPGSDIMGELWEAPLGREQFKLMLADRLRGFATE